MEGKHAASQQHRTAGRTHAGATVTPTPPTRGDVPTAWRTHGIAKHSKQQAGGLALRRRQHEATSFTGMYEYETCKPAHEERAPTPPTRGDVLHCVCMHTCIQDEHQHTQGYAYMFTRRHPNVLKHMKVLTVLKVLNGMKGMKVMKYIKHKISESSKISEHYDTSER